MPDGSARPILIVLSDTDVVARALGARWGSLPDTGETVDETPVRALPSGQRVVRRPGPHVHDEHVDRRLSPRLREARPTVIFPSIHRSESGQRCLTVHPLGNPTSAARLGGRPHAFTPADARLMTALLRRLDEEGRAAGVPATFEATHHGPELEVPALFAEIAVEGDGEPAPEEVTALARALETAAPDPRDRIALAAGGGHYAPHFTDLARSRRWAFGHILSRHALNDLPRAAAEAALAATLGVEGVLYARAQDREHPGLKGLAPALRDLEAPLREGGPRGSLSGTTLPTSGT